MGHTVGSHLAFQVSAVSSLGSFQINYKYKFYNVDLLQRDKLNAKNSTSIAVVVFAI